jgi:hypothetical protein
MFDGLRRRFSGGSFTRADLFLLLNEIMQINGDLFRWASRQCEDVKPISNFVNTVSPTDCSTFF